MIQVQVTTGDKREELKIAEPAGDREAGGVCPDRRSDCQHLPLAGQGRSG